MVGAEAKLEVWNTVIYLCDGGDTFENDFFQDFTQNL